MRKNPVLLNKKLVIGILVLFAGISIIPSSATNFEVNKPSPMCLGCNTLYVGGTGSGNYSKIQDAIDNASYCDTVFVLDDSSPYYENIVIDNALKAEKKWSDSLVAVYPQKGTLLSDHPYVLIDAEWVSVWQRFAASQYLLYLLKPEIQELAQENGLRPVNPSVPLDENLFSSENGVQYKIPVQILKPPSGEVLEAIFVAWVKARNPGV